MEFSKRKETYLWIFQEKKTLEPQQLMVLSEIVVNSEEHVRGIQLIVCSRSNPHMIFGSAADWIRSWNFQSILKIASAPIQGCRYVHRSLYIFENKPPQMVPMDLNIGETRVWLWFRAKSTTLPFGCFQYPFQSSKILQRPVFFVKTLGVCLCLELRQTPILYLCLLTTYTQWLRDHEGSNPLNHNLKKKHVMTLSCQKPWALSILIVSDLWIMKFCCLRVNSETPKHVMNGILPGARIIIHPNMEKFLLPTLTPMKAPC